MKTHSFIQPYSLQSRSRESNLSSINHEVGLSMPLQENKSNQNFNQDTSSSAQHIQALRRLQQTYYLERRCFI